MIDDARRILVRTTPLFRLRMEYKDGVALLHEVGVQMGSEDDLTTENERILGKIVKAKVCSTPTIHSERI